MPRPARPIYDSTEFRDRWMSGETIASIAAWLGVSTVAVWRAANRRGLPGKYNVRARQ